ncbi:MAG: tryptophan synthase subunit alpha [Planctomycetaceae bacterium]
MNRISATFQRLKSHDQMAFMPFVTCGDPDLNTTLSVIRELGKQGVDLIELGFPYSDPIADGPVIQASYTRALNAGLEVEQIFRALETLAGEDLPPLLAMVSFAIIFRIGTKEFVARARQAGFSGLIVPDLPGDESADFAEVVRGSQLDLIQLVAPTTPVERLERILGNCSGFVYCVSTTGTTGVREGVPQELHGQLSRLRSRTKLPLAVGFGISRPEHVDVLRGIADGVIVGSALVRMLDSIGVDEVTCESAVTQIGVLAAGMLEATRNTNTAL